MESADGMIWRKASYSGNNGGNCVEVGVWRKASYSGDNGGGCVEVAPAPATVAVRDSKDPHGPRLAFTPGDWREFTDQIKHGQTVLI
jgi:hypothetical protein